MKICTKCHFEKPLDGFHKKPDTEDGLNKICKSCRNLYRRKLYSSRIFQERERTKKWLKTRSGKDFLNKNQRKMRSLYPNKYKARYLVARAIKKGEITKNPCKVCGSLVVQAHHEDYSKPLDVIWLCARHYALIEGRLII